MKPEDQKWKAANHEKRKREKRQRGETEIRTETRRHLFARFHHAKGSATAFLALTILLMVSLVFALLESVRVKGLNAQASMLAMQATDSLMSQYHMDLWEDYQILGWQAGEGSAPDLTQAVSRQEAFIQENFVITEDTGESNYYFYSMDDTEITADEYELMTDNNGAAFIAQAVSAAQTALADDAIEELAALITGETSAETDTEEMEELEEDAVNALESLEEAAESAGSEESGGTNTQAGESGDSAGADSQENGSAQSTLSEAQKQQLLEENPITWLRKMKKKGILSVVMPEEDVSGKAVETENLLRNRSLNQGNYSEAPAVSSSDSALFRIYLYHYFDSVTDEKEDGVLDYEMEYLIAGKDSDLKNLKTAVRQLLLMREAVNYAYLQTDTQKKAQALEIATLITTAFAIPQLASAVQQGILVAWAYAESVCEVKTLLADGKVPLAKTSKSWQTELTNLSGSIQSVNEENTDGLSYNQFLLVLLAMKSDETLSLRAMELMELQEDIYMDCMVTRMDCTYVFQASPLFWRYVSIGSGSLSIYRLKKKNTFSYLE